MPRPGDWVYLAESDEGDGLFATPVTLVTWSNDGSITLTFQFEHSAQVRQLEGFGFAPRP